MAKIPKGATVKIDLPGGTAELQLREPTREELNKYQAEKFDMTAETPQAGIQHVKDVQVKFFDLLLTGISGLEDDEGFAICLDRKDLVPDEWKAEAITRRFDRTPVSIKN